MTATLVKADDPARRPPAADGAAPRQRAARPDHRPRLRPPRPAAARRARRLPGAVLRRPQLLRRLRHPVRRRRQLRRDVPATPPRSRPSATRAIWVVVAPTLLTGLGLVLAVLTEKIRWATAFKLLLFMPMAVSFLAAGIIFRLAYDEDPDKGVLNAAVVGVHDAFAGTSSYPTARARDGQGLTRAARRLRTVRPTACRPGRTVSLGLVGVAPDGPAQRRRGPRTRPPGAGRRRTNCAVSSTWTSPPAAEAQQGKVDRGGERAARR